MAVVAYTPVESSQPGFFVIPGYTIYGANRSGIIINLKTLHVKKPYRVRGYQATTVMSDTERKMKWVFIHRLVALAFHGPPPVDKPLVNHLDGSKDNNCPENLEWTNHSGNISHAYQNGQRRDNRPILARSLLTGDTLRFQTANDCARHFGVSGERIWRNVRDNTGNIYFGHYVFRYEDDERPWPELDVSDIGKVNNGDGKPVLAKEISTGNVYHARSFALMERIIGVGRSTIGYTLNSGPQRPCKGFLFKYQSDTTPWII